MANQVKLPLESALTTQRNEQGAQPTQEGAVPTPVSRLNRGGVRARPTAYGAADILAMQRAVGNRAVGQLLVVQHNPTRDRQRLDNSSIVIQRTGRYYDLIAPEASAMSEKFEQEHAPVSFKPEVAASIHYGKGVKDNTIINMNNSNALYEMRGNLDVFEAYGQYPLSNMSFVSLGHYSWITTSELRDVVEYTYKDGDVGYIYYSDKAIESICFSNKKKKVISEGFFLFQFNDVIYTVKRGFNKVRLGMSDSYGNGPYQIHHFENVEW